MSDDNYGDLHAWIEPEIEARIVAAILGEASDFEQDELERLMEERPELRIYRRRLEAVHGLIGDAVRKESGDKWKLAPQRRAELMNAIGTAPEARDVTVIAAGAARERRIGKAGRRVLAMAAACLLLTLILVPLIMPRMFKAAPGAVRDFLAEGRESEAAASTVFMDIETASGAASNQSLFTAESDERPPSAPATHMLSVRGSTLGDATPEDANGIVAGKPQAPAKFARESAAKTVVPQLEIKERLAELRANLGTSERGLEGRWESGGDKEAAARQAKAAPQPAEEGAAVIAGVRPSGGVAGESTESPARAVALDSGMDAEVDREDGIRPVDGGIVVDALRPISGAVIPSRGFDTLSLAEQKMDEDGDEAADPFAAPTLGDAALLGQQAAQNAPSKGYADLGRNGEGTVLGGGGSGGGGFRNTVDTGVFAGERDQGVDGLLPPAANTGPGASASFGDGDSFGEGWGGTDLGGNLTDELETSITEEVRYRVEGAPPGRPAVPQEPPVAGRRGITKASNAPAPVAQPMPPSKGDATAPEDVTFEGFLNYAARSDGETATRMLWNDNTHFGSPSREPAEVATGERGGEQRLGQAVDKFADEPGVVSRNATPEAVTGGLSDKTRLRAQVENLKALTDAIPSENRDGREKTAEVTQLGENLGLIPAEDEAKEEAQTEWSFKRPMPPSSSMADVIDNKRGRPTPTVELPRSDSYYFKSVRGNAREVESLDLAKLMKSDGKDAGRMRLRVEAQDEVVTRSKSRAAKPMARQSGAAGRKANELSDLASLPDRAALLVAALGDEKKAEAEAFSTFSLHVSDVSFKLAQAALAKGEWPQAERVRVEEFVNALDYGDPAPSQEDKVACQVEQAVHPFLQQRNLLRVSMRTAALGRNAATPLRLTVLLDNSGSMDRADRVESVRNAFQLLASQMNPQDELTLISFARTPRLLRDKVAGDKVGELVEVLNQIPSEGGTNLEQALRLGMEKAQENFLEGAQNRVVLLTDGAANLGNAKPGELSSLVETMRQEGIAFDACGVGAEGLNDEILESLTRKGDGRYYFLDRPEDADAGFARQIAGALRPAAKNVKVQIEFNPKRVGKYKLLGFEKHRLKKEDFRNDSVDAAELAAEEAGVAVYQFEAMPEGEGNVGTVSVRFQDMDSGRMVERNWTIPYEANPVRVEAAPPSMQLAASAAMLAEKLKGTAAGEVVNLAEVEGWTRNLQGVYPRNGRVRQLFEMTTRARAIAP